jgi:hypothetical protein
MAGGRQHEVRVVVTGHDENGHSVVATERFVGPNESLAAGTQFHLLWGSDSLPVYPDDGSEPGNIAPFPPVGGIRFVQMAVYPDADVDYSGSGVEGVQLDEDSPGMHITASVDFEVVLEGEVWLELDNGTEIQLKQGDCVVQNGTRHGWRNHTDQVARVGVMLIGTEHAGIKAKR